MRRFSLFLLSILVAAALIAAPADAFGRRDRQARKAAEAMTAVTLQSGGAERRYQYFRPASVTRPAPVVIMLHGGGGNGSNAAKMTGFNALAAEEGFVVVYPDGSGRGPFLTWNGGHCCQYAMEQDIDDVGFISNLIDDLVARGLADRTRVYVTGMSNGAIMAHRLGRELPHKIAAIAPVVGAMFGDEAKASPVPALMITGALDENVPAAGGYGVLPGREDTPPNDAPYASAEAALGYWMKANACATEARAITNTVYTLRSGHACGEPVLWYHLKAGTHSWPGGQKGHRRGDAPVRTFDASRVMWEFFEGQALKN